MQAISTIQRVLIIFITTLSLHAFAAEGEGGSGGGLGFNIFSGKLLFWLGVGSGKLDYTTPNTIEDVNTAIQVNTGLEFRVLGPVHLRLGVTGMLSGSHLDYDYLGTDSVNYALNDLSYTASLAGFQGGLKFKLIDKTAFDLYISAGGFVGGTTFRYDTQTNATILAQGSNALSEEQSVSTNGVYYEAGVDLFSNLNGLRLCYRVDQGSTAKIKALNDTATEFETSIISLAYLRVL